MAFFRLAAALLAVLALLEPVAAIAQSDTGTIVITVTDSKSKAPVTLARVLLDGPVFTSEFTGPDGKVIFQDVPTGIYRARVFKNGYQQVTSSEFEVLEGNSVAVDVALAAANLKTLATVDVTSKATISSSSVTDSSTVRKLSDTLSDALGKLSGVSVSTDPNGDSDAAETISLEGHDPSQTALTLDGVPLNAPGAAGDLNSIDSDLFAGASVSFSPQAGALGGGVNYRTLEPTLTWQGKLSTSIGDFGKASTTISEQGSFGHLGVAVEHTVRGSDSPLNGMDYLDSSGFDYVHSGDRLTNGNLIKLRDRLGEDQTLTGTVIDSNTYNDVLCTQFTGPVPCGYGPGNSSYRHYMFESLTDSALVGAVGLQASIYGTQSYFDRDLLARYVDLEPMPSSSDSLQNSDGFSLNAVLPAKERHTLSIQAVTTDADFHTSAFQPEFPVPALSTNTSYSSLQLSDSMQSNTRLTLGDHFGLSQSQGRPASLLGGGSATWQPSNADQYTASLDLGNSGAATARTEILSDPASLQFNCASGLAYGEGPGDLPGPQDSTSARVGWEHRFSFGQTTLQLYRQIQRGSLLNLAINATALPPGYFPPGYFEEAAELYESPLGCDQPASAGFGPQNIYINQLIADQTRVYQGGQFTGGVQIGSSLVAEPYYDIQGVTVRSDDPRLLNPYSYFIPGAQVPGTPLHKAGLALDYKAPASRLELLVDANYTSIDNSQNLPGYATADAGVAYGDAISSVTLAYTNVFDKDAALFATPDGAVPYLTIGGMAIGTVARPLSPRQYSLTYALKFGQIPAQAPAENSARRGGPGGGGFFSAIAPLPTSPPDHPLDVVTGRQQCTSADSTAAAQTLAAIKTYTAAVEAAKTSSGYPDAAPADAPAVPGYAIAYHKTAASYALVLTPTSFGGLRSFFVCAPLHAGTLDQAQALHLYVAPAGAFNRTPLEYAPEAGLYIVRRPPQANTEQFRVYRLPTTPPTQPFATIAGGPCTSDLLPSAQLLLKALSAYVSAYNPAAPPPAAPAGWTVTPHTLAGGKYWLELQPSNIETLPAVISCGHVAAAAEADLKSAGLDGARPPALNYAPQFGLYIVRNGNFGPGGGGAPGSNATGRGGGEF
jgi:hypothetical protein